jgi:hypothetical protein
MAPAQREPDQPAAEERHLEHAAVGDIVVPVERERAQLAAALGDGLDANVCDAVAGVEEELAQCPREQRQVLVE